MAARKKKVSDGKEEEIDILKHELVPEHRILAEAEKEKILEKFDIAARQLPRIQLSDPVAKRLGAKIGDVLEIKRKSPTAGVSLYYRHVVA